MTYRELNNLFFETWADAKGIIWGKPVALIYRMNIHAGSLDDIVDEELLERELKKSGLSLKRQCA